MKRGTKPGEKLLFRYGVEGGGASVFLLPDHSVVERGSSGGMLDEEEDPIRVWEKPFPDWEAWWQNFTSFEKWIYFHPLFIDRSVREFIRHDVEAFRYDKTPLDWRAIHTSSWKSALTRNHD